MLLVDIAPETKVILELDFDGHTYEFPSMVTNVDRQNNVIYAEPIRINGKVLSFSGSSVKVNLIMNREDKSPYVWKGIGIATVIEKKGTQYKIVASRDGFEMNRREAFRLFVGLDGVVQMGVNTKAIDVIVKDISENGFAFVSEEDKEEILNKTIRLVFRDLSQNFTVMGTVVRKVKISENKILYGCQLCDKDKKVEAYISEKQRQILSMKSRSAKRDEDRMKQALREKTRDESAVENVKKMTNEDAKNRRNINAVDKAERRQVFKNNYTGKQV